MGLIKKISWIIGFAIIFITILNLISNVLNINLSILFFILGALLIILPDLISFILNLKRTSEIGNVLEEHLRITENEILNYFSDRPAYKVLPFFRKYKKGILIMTSGTYIHYNDDFINNFITIYKKNNNITELSKKLKIPKSEIKDIIKKL